MEYSESECHYRIKIILIGDVAVGKTSLLYRLTYGYDETIRPTTGYEYFNKFYLFGDEIAQVHFWDTAGQDKFKSIVTNYYRKASGAVMVFDITNRASFESLKDWYKELKKFGEEAVEVIILGNK
mmetsp:Transcript_42793/g.50174  ORF Transcript_42793/g.50174 Transcript_42793/m.50174 type:complete len:125 (+) Transcript_42793:3-377(+)